jgi:histidinol-phosphatase (PHP family)
MTDDDLQEYVDDVNKGKETYKDKIRVHLGLEIEYLKQNEMYYQKLMKQVEYFVLGQHFIELYNGELFSSYAFSTVEHIEQYARTIEKALHQLPITILAHPDLYLFHYKTWDKNAERVARRICQAAEKTNTYLEYNANGMRRKKVEVNGKKIYPYPRKEFFDIVKEYDVKVVVSSDAHHPNDTYDDVMEQAVIDAKQFGLHVVEELTIKKLN